MSLGWARRDDVSTPHGWVGKSAHCRGGLGFTWVCLFVCLLVGWLVDWFVCWDGIFLFAKLEHFFFKSRPVEEVKDGGNIQA